jgi:hypothetical protein
VSKILWKREGAMATSVELWGRHADEREKGDA